MRYSIFCYVTSPGSVSWECAHDSVMSKSAAFGLANQFAQRYDVRVFRGVEVGKLVLELKQGETTGKRGIL